jgi:hypothetical protein
VGWFSKLFLGGGKMDPGVKVELEAEGLVMLEERLRGRISYSHFKAPGKRFHGKVVPLRLALGISEHRLVIRGGVGGGQDLVDTPFGDPRWRAVEVSLEDDDRVALRVDYDRMGLPDVSGELTIRAKTPNAPAIVDQLRSRMA